MFRLYDAASGQTGPVQPARPGLLRIWVADPATSQVIEGTVLRRSVVADLIRRVAQRHRLRVIAGHAAGAERGPADALRAAWMDLNVYPAELAAGPAEPPDIVVAQEAAAGDGGPHLWIRPGDARTGTAELASLDPLALRLALLERPYREPADLTRDTLETADRTLQRWRALVADWATSPSKPMCAQYVADVLDALDNDLDSPAALRAMHALSEDAELPPGSRFEAFAYLDQLLGLDLAREVGR